jgi:hypothetical protein
MVDSIKVSKKFISDFDFVIKYYEFPQDDIEFLKTKTRENYDLTRFSMEIIAGNVRDMNRGKNA